MSQDTTIRRSGRKNQSPVTWGQAHSRARVALSVAAVAACGMAGTRLLANTYTWDSSGNSATAPVDGSGNWDTSTPLWSDGTNENIWNNDNFDTAVLGNGGTAGTITLQTGINVGGLNFNAVGSGSYTVAGAGNTLTIGTSGITVNTGAGAPVISAGVALAGAELWDNSGAGLFTVSGNVANGGYLLTTGGTGTTLISGTISGTGGLTVGSGTLILTQTDAITGPTTINAGATIQYGNNTAGGSTLSGGTITDNGLIVVDRSSGNGTTIGVPIVGTGAFTLNTGGATFSAAGNYTYSGTTTINGATLTVGAGANLSSSALVFGGNNSTLSVSTGRGSSISFANGTTVDSGNSTITPGAALGAGDVLGLGALTRNTGGTLTFTSLPATSGSITTTSANADFPGGAQTILGGWAVVKATTSDSNWAVSNSGTIGAFSAYTPVNASSGSFTSGADILLGGTPATGVNAATTINSLKFNNATNTTVNLSAPLTIATGGVLLADAGNTLSFNNNTSGGSLTSGNGQDLIFSIASNATTTLNLNVPITDNGSTPVGLTMSCLVSGQLRATLSVASTFSGDTNINGTSTGNFASLTITDPNALQDSTVDFNSGGGNGGYLYFGTSSKSLLSTGATLGGLKGIENLTVQVSTGGGSSGTAAAVPLSIGNNNQSVTYSGVLTTSGSVTKIGSGTWTLAGVNAISGNLNINSGSLQLSGSGSVASTPVVTIAPTATFDLSARTLPYAVGSSQTIVGTGTILGPMTVSGGAKLDPMVTSANASLGTLTTGNLTFGSGGILNDFFGTPGTLATPGTSGLIDVAGNLAMSSSGVQINLYDNGNNNSQGSLAAGSYDILNYTGSLSGFMPGNSGSGTFSVITTPLTGRTYTFTNNATTKQIDLTISALAASLTWTGANGGAWDNSTINWANSNNSNAAVAYTDPDTVTFNDNSAITGNPITNTSVTIQAGGVSPGGVVFNANTANYTFSNSGGDLVGINGSTGITMNGTGTVTLAGPNSFGGPVNVNAGALIISNSGSLGVSGPLSGVTIRSGAALQMQGGISTPAGVTLSLAGTGLASSPAGALQNLSGSNTYAGAITLAGDTTVTSTTGGLTLGGGVTNGGHNLSINGAGNVTLNSGISGAGGLNYTGSGTLSLPAGSTYSGNSSIGGGTVAVGGDSALGSFASAVAINGNATIQASANANLMHTFSVAPAVTATFDTNNNNMMIGPVTGASAAGLTKINNGTLTMSGLSSYGGSTLISGGTLQLSPALSVQGETLHVDASTLTNLGSTVANLGTLGGAFTASGSLSGLNGRQALTFSGTGGQLLQMGQSGGPALISGTANTIFYIGYENGTTAQEQVLSGIGPGGTADYNSLGNILVETNNQGINVAHFTNGGNAGDSITYGATSVPVIYDTTLNTATGSLSTVSHTIINSGGVAQLNTASGTPVAGALNINQFGIAGRFNGTTTPSSSYAGQIGEVLVFNSVLSASDRAAVEAYLEAKWLGIGTSTGNLPTTSAIQVASGATLDLNGTAQQVPSISNVAGSGGTITNSAGVAANLMLAPTSGSNTFSGSIQDSNGQVGVTFNGTGTGVQILNGNNNYSGPTSINSGTFVLGAGSSLGNTAVTVASGATLAVQTSSGSISLGGTLNLVNGATLDMTDGSIGTLYVNGAAPALKIGSATGSAATLKFDLSSSGADEIVVSNTASVTGTNTIGIVGLGTSLTNGATYPLITASGGLAGAFEFSNGLTTESITVGSTLYDLSLTNTSTTEDILVQIPGITAIWAGAGSTTNTTAFATASNWSTNPTVPGGINTTTSLDTIVFNSSPANLSPVIDAFRNVQNITFDTANVGGINLTGSTLVLSANGITQTTSTVTNNEKISVPIVVEGDYTFISNSATNATLTLAGAIGDGGSSPVTITLAGGSTGPNTVSGVISDASGTTFVTKAGSGTWVLASSNTYSGDTNINSGILQIVNGALGSSGNVIFNGGTLQYATGANQDLSNRINNSTAPVTIDTNGNTVNYAGTISSSNTAGLTKLGAGTLIFSGSNSYGGATLVNAGALNVNNSSGLPSNTTVTVASGAAMQLSGSVNVSSVPLMINGTGVTASPAGALDSLNGSNTYGGNITLAGNSTVQVDSGSLTVSGNISGANTLTLSGAAGGTVSGVISIGTGGVTMNGPGTWALSAANTYTGVTTINGGVLQINSSTSMGALPGSAVINSGTLEVTSTFSTPRAFSLGSASSTMQVDPGQTYAVTGNIGNGSSPGTLNKTGVGTLMLSGSNSYSGGTNITAGTLVAGSPSALGTSTVTLSGSAPTLQILPSPVGPVGFGYAGNIGWKLNTGDANTPASVSSANVLTLTTPANAENRSAFYTTPVPYSNFTASYVYQSGTPGTNTGDGIMFVLQNSPAGSSALGPNGDTDAYGGITNSVAVGWELYGNQGVAQGSNGVLAPYVPTVPVGLLTSADPILVTVTGSAASSVLNMTLTDQASSGTFAGDSYSTSFNLSGSLSSFLGGPTAYVGFTGSTGGANSLQTVSDFSYANPFIGSFSAGNPVAVTTNSTIDVSYAGGAALGSLSIGGNTLSFTNASGSGAALTMGGVNLSGSPTLAVVAGVQVNLGALNDNAAAKTVTIAGAASNAIVNLTSPATSFVAGSSIQVSGGTLLVTNTTGSATGSGSVFVQSGAFIGGTGAISGPVFVANAGSLFVGLTNDTPNKSAGVLNIGSGSQLLGSTLLDLTDVSTSDELVVGGGSGSVNLSGGILTITVPNTFDLGGGESFQLFDFGSESGTFSAVILPALTSGRTWNTSLLYSAGVISVTGSSAFNNLIWDNIGTGDGMTWDKSGSAASQNWNNSGTAAGFNTGDFVTFTDANLGKYTVTINGTVLPSSTTVNNSSGAYTFSGGSIGGSGGLTKLGTASLVLANTNTYSGATNVSGGSLILQSSSALPASNHLIIGSGASVVASTLGTEYAVRLGSLTINGGQLDLTRNALVLHQAGALPSVDAWVASGYNNGAWNGTGIASSTAATDTTHLTALGAIVNDNGSGTPLYGAGGSIATTFDGASPVDGDILVKYTYYGDANLDGKVDASDYTRIDNGYLNQLTGWYNGDFNYDGVVNGSDYTLIDNVFNMQGASLADEDVSPSVSIAAQISPASVVPEPATLGLLAAGSIGLLARRRRRMP